MARHPRKEGTGSKKRGKKSASGRRGAPKRPQKSARKNAAKAAKASKSNRRASVGSTLAKELKEAQARQAATAEILKIIASSPDDVKPVFEAIVRTIVRLVQCDRAHIMRCDGNAYYPIAIAALDGSFSVPMSRAERIDPAANFPSRAIVSKQTVHYRDWSLLEIPEYERMIHDKYGVNSSLYLPLLRKGECIGLLALSARQIDSFDEGKIALAESFRDQALIAIENARLFHETNEALAQQTATSDVLQVISSSMGKLEPVFQQMLEKATQVCGAEFGAMGLYDGDTYRRVAVYNMPPAFSAVAPREWRPASDGPVGRALRTGQVVWTDDLGKSEAYRTGHSATMAMVDVAGARTHVAVPMLKEGKPIGAISIYRQEVRPFSDRQVELLKNFASQAVIAIENTRLFNETKEALARQTATSEVLQVISSSPGDLRPVFDQMLAKAMRLCEAQCGFIYQMEQGAMRAVAEIGVPPAFAEYRRQHLHTGGAATPVDVMRATRKPAHVHDARDSEPYRSGNPNAVAGVDLGGARTVLYVPMIRNDDIVGVINLYRQEVRPFTGEQIALLENFASQAVIAIENARLFNETNEALERQTATADILKVIASSPSDVQPVFEAIAASANRLLGGHSSGVARLIDGNLHLAAFTPVSPEADAVLISLYPAPTTLLPFFAELARGEPHQEPDMEAVPVEQARQIARARGYRSLLAVPLMNAGQLIGVVSVARVAPGTFAAEEVQLLQTFAAQAVIAIENARLFNETQESLARQTATADVLSVIASSPTDVKPVLDAIVESACKLCEASDAYIALKDGDDLVFQTQHGSIPVAWKRKPINRQWPAGRAVIDGKPVHLRDILTSEGDEFPDGRDIARTDGARGVLTVPLMREGESIGVIILRRTEVQPFTDKQMALLRTFADQAVIAIENVRLFNETKEALERQTATADILKVIASSPDDVQPVFEAIAERSNRLLNGRSTAVHSLTDDMQHLMAFTPINPAADAALKSMFPRPRSEVLWSEAIRRGEVVRISDAETELAAQPAMREAARLRGWRSNVIVPLVRDKKSIGQISVTRAESGLVGDHHVQLLQTFADQAVIAIENVRLFNETKEALAQQTATADVLSVISSSVADTAPVFEKILDSCEKLFATEQLGIFVVQPDGQTHVGAWRGSAIETVIQSLPRPAEETATGAVIRSRAILHIPNTATASDVPPTIQFVREQLGGVSMAWAPMLTEEGGIGSISVMRQPPNPFSDKELALLKTFADQAVIAIQNTRLFNETREALARQTATADVLKVIASSPSDLQPVFDAIAERSKELIGGHSTTVFRFAGDITELVAATPVSPEADAVLRATFPAPISEIRNAEQILRGEISEIVDVLAETGPDSSRNVALVRGWRSRLVVPLKGDNDVIGFISITRKEPGKFADKDKELVRTFADQAVIAIQNVELFEEVQARTRDLQESLQQQTATADVLKVISRSAFDLNTIMKTLPRSAVPLCGAASSTLWLREDDRLVCRGSSIDDPAQLDFMVRNPVLIDTESHMGRTLLTGTVSNIPDIVNSQTNVRKFQEAWGFRAFLAVPLMREGRGIGVFTLSRNEVGAFSERQVELVQTFADQAVIAIENTRLFNETREALERQTATADILKVIASSPDDVQPVFEAIAERSNRIVDGRSTAVYSLVGEVLHLMAFTPTSPDADAALRAMFPSELSKFPWGDAIRRREVYQIPDLQGLELAERRGFRSMMVVPLVSEQQTIGVIGVTRVAPGKFADHHVQLLQTFADQAVIAISNVELFREVQQRTRELSQSLDDLRAAQDRLVQTEKLASLGQLTAGIAHEIKNPLNFVNNFSALSVELTDELNDVLKQAQLAEKIETEVGDLTQLLKSNLEKVVQHGKRADSIVKNMLLHSREGSGEQRAADINALVEESLNLAYHGARAEKSGFNITLERAFDAGAGEAMLFPQEITRALLNLISNGFYAATRRKAENGEAAFEPTLLATTKDRGTSVEIRIRDNGTGIPPDVKEKMFNPFFTTKPAGEGTGLGLSMTHDIIVKQHGGTIDVATEPGSFTEFIVVLPRANGAHGKSRGH